MNIYLPSGYLNVPLVTRPSIFHTVIMVGSRGTGKSYGVLDDRLMNHNGELFFYIRTQANELELMKNPKYNPFKPINQDRNTNFELTKGGDKFTYDVMNGDRCVCTCGALSTMYKARGMDASEYKALFYDEFIPEPHVRKMKHQGRAIKALYETLNRNRELDGEPPLKLIMCANSDDINNDILIEYNVLDDLLDMRSKGQEVRDFPDRGLRLVYTLFSPIAERKKQTALYKGSEDSEYTRMALGNEFTGYYTGNIKSQDLKNFEPLVMVSGLCIYKSKTDHNLYVTRHITGNFSEQYGNTDFEISKFQRKYHKLNFRYYQQKIKFENASCEIAFINLWEVKR